MTEVKGKGAGAVHLSAKEWLAMPPTPPIPFVSPGQSATSMSLQTHPGLIHG